MVKQLFSKNTHTDKTPSFRLLVRTRKKEDECSSFMHPCIIASFVGKTKWSVKRGMEKKEGRGGCYIIMSASCKTHNRFFEKNDFFFVHAYLHDCNFHFLKMISQLYELRIYQSFIYSFFHLFFNLTIRISVFYAGIQGALVISMADLQYK